MKNLYKYLITGVCLSLASLSALAFQEPISLGMALQEDNEEEDFSFERNENPHYSDFVYD